MIQFLDIMTTSEDMDKIDFYSAKKNLLSQIMSQHVMCTLLLCMWDNCIHVQAIWMHIFCETGGHNQIQPQILHIEWAPGI